MIKFEKINKEALENPQVGDYWSEHFCPYFLIVKIEGDDIYVLSTMGGAHSFNRKYELNAKIDGVETWSFDYSKAMIVDKAWIEKAVKYDSIEGFVADVLRKGNSWGFVQEWEAYQTVSNSEIPRLKDLIPPPTPPKVDTPEVKLIKKVLVDTGFKPTEELIKVAQLFKKELMMIEYDMSIHTNPDAQAWSKFFMKIYKDKPFIIDEEIMTAWFANSMMAMHDYLQGGVPLNGDHAQYLLDQDKSLS